jgi:glycine hydroxymethyltransferase
MKNLKISDPDVYNAIKGEISRQQTKLELIASENFVSKAVLEALGCVMTNKYAEGYPSRRYYGGCEYVDITESLAIQRAKKLFSVEYVNVQPHSGSQANMEAYFSCLNFNDTILAMDLACGGHLTHGSPVNFSGKFFKVIPYGVTPDTYEIDYDNLEKLAQEHKPKMLITGFSSYPRALDFKRFREIADKVGAILLSDIAHPAGLIATKLYPDPVPYCDIITTTTHKTLRGPRGGMIMARETFGKKIDKMVFPGMQGGPLEHVIAAKAVCFHEALEPSFKEYQKQVIANAKTLANELKNRDFKLITNGTDCHLMLINLTNKQLTGKEAESALDKAGITVNKNMIPFDRESPFVTSGIRIGTPAVTTRGMKEPEMKQIAQFITIILEEINNENRIKKVVEEVKNLCQKFPLYPDII